jgi:hypothetical protein
MTMTRTLSLPWLGCAKPVWPDIERAGSRQPLQRRLRRLWADLMALPDRGAAATANDVPTEFYRYPCF